MALGCERLSYILVTPARNEEALIEKTIQSVVCQTHQPLRWVIVDDGSTDATPDIVTRYKEKHDWIELVQMPRHRDRSFAAKVYAFQAGYAKVKSLEHDVIGNMDADVTFEGDYLEFLLAKFQQDPKLGVAGTVFREDGYSSETQSFEGVNHVAGGCQLFRRSCFEEIGGFLPNKAGGVDWIAVTTARMKGWTTRSFRERFFFHHRKMGTAERSAWAAGFSYGEKDYYLGGHPLWELLRVAYQATKQPYLLGGLALALGYCSASLRRMERPVSDELVKFHRQEQMLKLKLIVQTLLRLKRVDGFEVMSNK